MALPSQYPTYHGFFEQPQDYIVVLNETTGERHLLGDWNGVLNIQVLISEDKGVHQVKRKLTSDLAWQLGQNPANRPIDVEILKEKIKQQTRARKARRGAERIIYRVKT